MHRALSYVIAASLVATGSIAAAQQKNPPAKSANSRSRPGSTWDARHPNANMASAYNSNVLLNTNNRIEGSYAQAKVIGQCLAKKGRGKARELVGGPMTDDPNYEQLVKGLERTYSTCFREEAVGVPLMIINSALAEELIRGEGAIYPDRSTPVDLAEAKSFYTDAAGHSMASVGRCLAIFSPGLAYRVVAAGFGTAAESSAMTALYSGTPECGVPAPPENVPEMEQRSAIANGLYQWTHRG